MNVVVVGLSFKTTPIAVREQVSFPERILADALGVLYKKPQIKECLILSTCNRVEIYAVVNHLEDGIKAISSFMATYHGLTVETLANCLYLHCGHKAVTHLFRVVASLDSMVVGEPQIFGQVKLAYAMASEQKTTSLIFNKLFETTNRVGKRIRNETDIARCAVSISFAAVELARKIFGTIEGKNALIIGAGEMSELTAKHLISNGVTGIFVTNRTYSKAEELAAEFKGQAVKFEEFLDFLVQIDIVISSTGAPHTIIHKDEIAAVLRKRKNSPIFFIDIAVPRDIDAAVNEVDNAYLYDIDDLQTVVQANIDERTREIPRVEAIIGKEERDFAQWFSTQAVVPTIVALRDGAESIRRRELDKTIGKLGELSEKERNHVVAMSKAIVNKILHRPVTRLKDAACLDDAVHYDDALRHLFDLGENKKRQ